MPGGLAGVEHTGIRAFQAFGILVRHGGNAAHALHDVQHQAFRLQQRLHLAFHHHSHIARLHFGAVVDEHFHFHVGVETAEDFLCHFDACQYARFLNQKSGFPHRRGGNARQGGMVAIANVFGECQIDQTVNQFFFFIHLSFLFLFDV